MSYARIIHRAIGAVALAMACYHLWVAFSGPPNALVLRSVHVGFALTLAFLALPARKGDPIETPSWLDLGLVAFGDRYRRLSRAVRSTISWAGCTTSTTRRSPTWCSATA